ncbi:MAG: DUF4922 domain-containing protein [Syntrophorhabdales bacterium]
MGEAENEAMRGSHPIPVDTVYSAFDSSGASRPLADLCLDLLKQQVSAWPACGAGYKSLESVREREISCSGFSVRVQHNPGRIVSTLAAVGDGTVRELPCFLCPSNLPEGQKAVLYRDEYLILCNPMPVLPSHFTISHIAHERQAIGGRVGAILGLAADFGPSFRLLYNGPKCGASAPAHFHFQAVPSGRMPIEREIQLKKAPKKRVASVAVSLARNIGREVVILEGSDPAAMEEAFHALLGALSKVLPTDGEPMMNLICIREKQTYAILVFPRAKHRPDAFYLEDEGRLAVSPAVVEMGGLIVAPLSRDFERIDAACVEGIFREVSLDAETVEQAVSAMG